MADSVLKIILQVNDGFSQPLQSFDRSLYFASASLLAFSYRINDLIKPFEFLNNAILASSVAIGGLATATAYFTTTAAAQFEESMANISTLVHGLADDAVPNLTNKILELSTELPQKVNNLAEAFYFVQSAMPGNIDNFEILEQAARGATVGLSDTLTVADALTTVMNAFGKSTKEEATVAMNEMFGAVVQGKVTMTTLAQNIGTVAAAASNAGLAMNEMLGAYALVTRITGQASRSATGLRGALLSLAKPSGKAELAFRRQGIAIRDASGGMRNLIDIVGEISEKQLAYNQIAEMFPRARTINTILALIENYDMLKDIIGEVGNSAELMGEGLGEVMDILKSKLTITGNLIEQLSIILGDEFAQRIKPAIDSLNEFLKVLVNWGKESEVAGTIAEEMVGGLADVFVKVFGELSRSWEDIFEDIDFSDLEIGFNKFKDALSDLLDVDYSGLEGLSGVIQLLSDVLGFFFSALSGYINTWDAMITTTRGVGEAFGFFSTIVTGTTREIVNWNLIISELVGSLGAFALPLKALVGAFTSIITVLGTLLTAKYLVALVATFGTSLPASLAATLISIGNVTAALLSLKAVIYLGLGIAILFAVKQLSNLWQAHKEYDEALKTSQKIIDSAVDRINKKYGTFFEKTEEGYKESIQWLQAFGDATEEEYKKAGSSVEDWSKKSSDAHISVSDKVKRFKEQLKATADDIDAYRLALKWGLIDSPKEAEREIKKLTDSLEGIARKDKLDPLVVSMELFKKAAKDVSNTIKEIDTVGDMVFGSLGININQASQYAVSLRNDLMLSGVKPSLANLTTQVGLLGGAITQSSKSLELFSEAKKLMREGLLKPTKDSIKAMEELKDKLVGLDLAKAFVGGAEEVKRSMSGISTQAKNLISIFPHLGGAMKTDVTNGIGVLVEEFRKLKIQMGDTEAAGASMLELLNEMTGISEFAAPSQIKYSLALRDVDNSTRTLLRSLSSQASEYGVIVTATNNARNALKALGRVNELTPKQIAEAWTQLRSAISDIEGAYSDFGDESDSSKEASTVLGRAMSALSKITSDVTIQTKANENALKGQGKAAKDVKTATEELATTFSEKIVKALGIADDSLSKTTKKITDMGAKWKSVGSEIKDTPIMPSLDDSLVMSSISNIQSDYESMRNYIANNPIVVTVIEKHVEG